MYHTLRLCMLGETERACIYDVQAYDREEGVTVILSEVPANKGRISITKAVEYVATDVVRGLLEKNIVIDPGTIEWIENHPLVPELGYRAPGRNTVTESFEAVELSWSRSEMRYTSPDWRPYGDGQTPPAFEEDARVI